MSFYKNDDGRNHQVARPPTTRDNDVTRGDGTQRRRDAGRRGDDGAATMGRGGSDGRSARRNMIGNPDSFQRSKSPCSQSQHHVPPQEYVYRSTAAVGSSGAPPPRKRNDSFRVSSPSGCNGGPRGRSLSAIRAASNSQLRHDEGKGRPLSRPTRPIPNEKLILIDDRGRQIPRSQPRSRFREVKESESETKLTQDESFSIDKSRSPSQRKSSAQIIENHCGHSRGRSGSLGRSKSLQSNDATTAFSSTSMTNACRLTSSRKFVVEMGVNNEIVQVFEFTQNGTLPPPNAGAIPDKAMGESASSKRGGTNACDGESNARRETEKGTDSPYSSSPPIIKTRSRSSSRANSQEAFASSVLSSSREAVTSSSHSSLRGSQGNLSQGSVSFAVDSGSNDSYYRRSLDISARSDDSHYRQSNVSSMSDLALEISERSSESNSRRSVRFFIEGDRQPESSNDTNTMTEHSVIMNVSRRAAISNAMTSQFIARTHKKIRRFGELPSPSNRRHAATEGRRLRSSTDDIERPIFSPPCGPSSTTTVVTKDRSASPRQPRTLSRFLDFDPAASTTESRRSPTVPTPTHHNNIHLRPPFSKGLLGCGKSSIRKSMLTESTEDTYSVSALTADRSISTNHTSRAVAEDDIIMFSTLDLESVSCDNSSTLSDPTAFMNKLTSTRIQGRAAKEDAAIAQASKEESRIGKILSLKVSSSKRRTELKLNNPRETRDTWSRDPYSVSVTQNSLVCNQSHACDHEAQDYEGQKLHMPKFFRR